MKTKILVLIFILGTLFIIFISGFFHKIAPRDNQTQKAQKNTPVVSQNDKPQIISTKPDPLEEAIISATQIVEITFNRPLENVGEFKSKIEPKIDYKVKLSDDRKTAKIIPANLYELGATYTLFIGTETKFDGVGRWGEEKIFHYKTIRYTGV